MDFENRSFNKLKNQEEKIVTLYLSGMTVREIAKKVNISKSTIGDFIKIKGISRNDFSGSKNPFYGKTHSLEFRQKQSELMKGKPSLNKGISKYGKTKYFSGMTLGRWIKNAAVRNITYNISNDFLDSLWEKQQGRCALTGLEMSTDYYGDKFSTVSLDRINSNGSYTENNVQFVLGVVNLMKNSLSDDQFKFYCYKVTNNVNGQT